MHSVENIINAFSDFLKSIKYAGVLKDYELRFEQAPFLNDAAEEAMCKALQQLVETLNSQAQVDAGKCPPKNGSVSDTNIEMTQSDEVSPNAKPGLKNPDPLVQIKVDRDELDRRIACFTTRKRKEIEESNCKEFCNNVLLDEDDPLFDQLESCARVDAVYVRRQNPIKVTRVDNCWGPQTVPTNPSQVTIKQEPPDDVVSSMPKDFEERLRNVESHLNFDPESKQRKYLYTWLKDLEDRILYLESMSPEYFNHKGGINASSPQKKSRLEKLEMLSALTAEELDRRRQQLKEELKYRENKRMTISH